jgi:hypothetical protein
MRNFFKDQSSDNGRREENQYNKRFSAKIQLKK